MEEKILIPLDGSKAGEAALYSVAKIVENYRPDIKVAVTLMQVLTTLTHYVIAGEASVQVLYTDSEMAQIRREVTDYLTNAGAELKSKGIDIKIKIVTGNAAEEILKAAEEIDATFIAMSTHGRSGFSRWALGSVADRVIHSSPRPVLVIRAKK